MELTISTPIDFIFAVYSGTFETLEAMSRLPCG